MVVHRGKVKKGSVKKGDSLFKVDNRAARAAEKKQPAQMPGEFTRTVKKLQHQVKQKISPILSDLMPQKGRRKRTGPVPMKRGRGRGGVKLPLWFKVDDLQVLKCDGRQIIAAI